jgi:hypothetical protein
MAATATATATTAKATAICIVSEVFAIMSEGLAVVGTKLAVVGISKAGLAESKVEVEAESRLKADRLAIAGSFVAIAVATVTIEAIATEAIAIGAITTGAIATAAIATTAANKYIEVELTKAAGTAKELVATMEVTKRITMATIDNKFAATLKVHTTEPISKQEQLSTAGSKVLASTMLADTAEASTIGLKEALSTAMVKEATNTAMAIDIAARTIDLEELNKLSVKQLHLSNFVLGAVAIAIGNFA